MKNKCSVFFFSVLFILALSFVLGESSCSSEDTILKLSSETNAHAAIWNDTNYDSSLCYTDFFNNEGKTLSHECEGSNILFWLNSESNAHASAKNYEFVYGGGSEETACEGVAKITLGGNVAGCRKGRTTSDYDLDIPVNFYASSRESVEMVVQSNVQVRKQADCGEFTWSYNLSCDSSGNILVNGESGRVRVNPVRGIVSEGYSVMDVSSSKYFNSGSRTNGYINPIAYLGIDTLPEPNEEIKVTLVGNVEGCRKGRTTSDYDLDIPIYYNSSEDWRVYIVQSNVRVRKSANCGEFLWVFNVSKDTSGDLLVNGKSERVRADPVRRMIESGYTKSLDIEPQYFNSGDSLNGYINPVVYTSSFPQILTPKPLYRERYDVPVCYGDLTCEVRIGECEDNETLIASLSGEYNAHVSLDDLDSYDYKVCCREDLSFGSAEWENLLEEEIQKASLGDTVLMSVEDDEIYKGNNISFDVYVDVDSLLTEDELIYEGMVTASEDTFFSIPWRINLTKDYEGQKIYFVAEIYDSLGDMVYLRESNSLLLEAYNDTPMVVKLVSPDCGEDFTLGDVAEISVSAYDDDDVIYGNVTIDGKDYPFSNGVTSFDYNLGRAGNIGIVVYAENTRGERSKVSSNIMVVDKTSSVDRKYLAACIDEPEDFARIPSGWVLFNASSTRALQYDGSTGEVSEILKEDLTFDWVFSDGDFRRNRENNQNPYFFRKFFNRGGDNQARLSVGFR